MKIPLGDGSYLEPDDRPRDLTRHYKRILRVEKIPGTRNRHNLTLECGHGVTAYGDLAHAEGIVLCTKCRDLEAGE